MTVVNIAEAKASLSELIRRLQEGEDIVIAKRNVPLAKLVLIDTAQPARSIGWARGQITMADDFDDTPDDFFEYS